jgi:hypothetical protein
MVFGGLRGGGETAARLVLMSQRFEVSEFMDSFAIYHFDGG